MRPTLPFLGEKAILSDMPYKEGSSLGDKRKQCLPGTRTGMSVWVNADTSEDGHQSICVLAGPAGTGKSAIAHSMTVYFKTLHRLAASFGFKRAPGSDGLTKLFPTIAQNMADFDEDIRKALCAAVGGDKALRMTHDLEEQFDNFILAPLKKIVFSGPVLIVIDALDECGSSSEQEELAGLLARRAKDFPPNLRIVITCRPELHIIQRFKEEASHVVIRDMENVDSTSQDIRSYVHFRLIDDCRPKLAGIDERDCTELAEASQGLFQWASVACAQIVTRTAGLTPLEIHKRLVESTSGVDQVNLLDALYKEVLKRFFDMNDETVKDRFRTVLGMIFGSFEPLSMVGLVAMCQDYCDVTLVLDFLGSLLSVPPNISHDPVRPIHTSFRDFLLDPDRSGDFFVDGSDAHQRLALASLRVMNRELVFNICALKSSWERNDEVSDLAYRIKKHIPHHLLYSCRFWAQHLQTPDSQFEQLFNTFILGKLLFFLEVLSLTGDVSSACNAFDSFAELQPVGILYYFCEFSVYMLTLLPRNTAPQHPRWTLLETFAPFLTCLKMQYPHRLLISMYLHSPLHVQIHSLPTHICRSFSIRCKFLTLPRIGLRCAYSFPAVIPVRPAALYSHQWAHVF